MSPARTRFARRTSDPRTPASQHALSGVSPIPDSSQTGPRNVFCNSQPTSDSTPLPVWRFVRFAPRRDRVRFSSCRHRACLASLTGNSTGPRRKKLPSPPSPPRRRPAKVVDSFCLHVQVSAGQSGRCHELQFAGRLRRGLQPANRAGRQSDHHRGNSCQCRLPEPIQPAAACRYRFRLTDTPKHIVIEITTRFNSAPLLEELVELGIIHHPLLRRPIEKPSRKYQLAVGLPAMSASSQVSRSESGMRCSRSMTSMTCRMPSARETTG